ncbi:MAG: hypothetical protein JXA30_09355 [Deltaproteobacteria bacterium]|nr:hypothetical protein [Deltaproteobacteria bacterium]
MKTMTRIRSLALARDIGGLSTVEYVIILCILAVLAISTWNSFGKTVRTKIGAANTSISGIPTR